jgi:hypothetical protein
VSKTKQRAREDVMSDNLWCIVREKSIEVASTPFILESQEGVRERERERERELAHIHQDMDHTAREKREKKTNHPVCAVVSRLAYYVLPFK